MGTSSICGLGIEQVRLTLAQVLMAQCLQEIITHGAFMEGLIKGNISQDYLHILMTSNL